MWLLLVEFLKLSVGYVFRSVVIKFVLFTAFVLLIAALALIVLNYLANVDFIGLSNLIGNLPEGMIWFLQVFQFHIGIPLLLGAAITRFAIRRIPFLG